MLGDNGTIRAMRGADGVVVRQDFEVEGMGGLWEPKRVPIVINNFNRLSYLRRVVDALRARGYENIYVIDNDSTYEPLLQYYRDERLRVFHLDSNVGYLALWTTPVGASFVGDYYVYTDSDIEPAPECPDDFFARFREGLDRYPKVDKVGFGLRIDDLPEHYALKERVVEHERRFLTARVRHGFYRAQIDTTLALYRPMAAGGAWLRCLRTTAPYVARHLPWYEDSARPTEEEIFYRDTIRTSTHWTLRDGTSDAGVISVPLWGEPIRVAAGRHDDLWNMVSRGEWRPESYDILDRFLDESHAYLEIGSGPGQTALYAGRLARAVYAVEPDPERFAELKENIRLNAERIPNITALSVQVSGIQSSPDAPSFDELVGALHLPDRSLVSVDLDGNEYRFLSTMLGYLKRRRPTLYLTLHPGSRFGITAERPWGKAAIAILGLFTTLGVLRRLRFYGHRYDTQGNKLTLWRLLHIIRSSIPIVATDQEWLVR
jgi:SAM-dependent methyltransferase